ncbi:hypothetical protein [Bradyrhizobium sp. WSM1253]|uniref:hypothetical protein n=1 Tax=Bradyrhizobium sp. WSM1253 TaxID=319003 RepID=UPI0002D66740|nr:hypothetical protein [Bradyrhizobium sp. WSM1253]
MARSSSGPSSRPCRGEVGAMVWSVQKIRAAQQVEGSNNLACGHGVHRWDADAG